MKLSRHIILFIILLIAGLSLSCSNDTNSIQVKNWKILYEQDESLDTISRKSGWKPVQIPSTFKLPYKDRKGYQYAWLKGKFNIKKEPADYYGITMGRIYHSDRVFINNHFIDSIAIAESSNIHTPRNYIIPQGILKKGENEVYVYLGIFANEYGGILNDVQILPKLEFRQTEFSFELAYEKLPIGISASLISVLLMLIVCYFWSMKEKLILFGSLVLLMDIVSILSLFLPNSFLDLEYITAIYWIAYPLSKILILLFVQSLYKMNFPGQNRIIVPFLFLVSIIIVFSHKVMNNLYFGLTMALLSEIVFLIYFIFIIYRLNQVKPDKLKFYVMIVLIALVQLEAYADIYLYVTGSRFTFLIGAYSSFFYLLSFSLLIIRDVVKRLIESEYLYSKLKIKDNNKISITDESEEKLKMVIDFIDENFTSDISREGLASAVEMSPDYMSRLFKAYNGMKINEYINKRRIEEAVIRLKNKDTRIIDIAFAVGFENIMTFNRAFKAIMDVTPSKYRANIDSE